jgi:hypothetical protein
VDTTIVKSLQTLNNQKNSNLGVITWMLRRKMPLIMFLNIFEVGNCNIFVKRKILVINEMKRDEILLKLKVCDRENFYGIP